jgi:hypothetical protein
MRFNINVLIKKNLFIYYSFNIFIKSFVFTVLNSSIKLKLVDLNRNAKGNFILGINKRLFFIYVLLKISKITIILFTGFFKERMNMK